MWECTVCVDDTPVCSWQLPAAVAAHLLLCFRDREVRVVQQSVGLHHRCRQRLFHTILAAGQCLVESAGQCLVESAGQCLVESVGQCLVESVSCGVRILWSVQVSVLCSL